MDRELCQTMSFQRFICFSWASAAICSIAIGTVVLVKSSIT